MTNMADPKKKLDEVMNTPDKTSEYAKSEIDGGKIMGVLSYLGILVLIPLFLAKDSKYARFHTNQGLTLFLIELIGLGVLGIVAKIPLIGWIGSIAQSLLGLACVVLAIIGIINVANGRAKELPVIGGIKILK